MCLKLEDTWDIDVKHFKNTFSDFIFASPNCSNWLKKKVDLIQENWDSGYVFNSGMMQDFFSVFAVYFPAGIGILAGANISGDLKV